jgi:hypothetical protein
MPKISRTRSILLVICLVVIIPIALYIAARRVIVKGLIGLQRKAAKLTVKSLVVGDHTIVYSEGGTGDREITG